jgi:hypothetical protein
MERKYLLIVLLSHIHFALAACTIISAAMNGEVLAGANEDFDNPFVRMWFNPPTKDRYGSVCFGFPDLQPQAAMNEYGLFFDFTAQEGIDPSKLNLKNPYYGDLTFEILGKCKNVGEVLAFLKNHDYAFASQALIADASGRSLVINAGIIVEKTGSYQINTNFNICNVKDRNFNCWRYELAEKELSTAKQISIDYFKTLLKNTSQQGKTGTLYSNIYDLKRGLIYVYLYRNFDEVYVIDLKKELSKGYRVEALSSHFKKRPEFEQLVKNHPEFNREQVLSEINQNGVDATLKRYESLKKADTLKQLKVNEWLVDAAIISIVNAYNKHSSGGAWHYWYNFPTSYNVWHGGDDLKDATRIFEWLLESKDGVPPQLFENEMLGYLNVMQGNKKAGEVYYTKALAAAPKESGNYKRSQQMLSKIK